MTDPFAVLADPTRRRILELLAAGERSAGDVTAVIRSETGFSQPTVSQHLGVLRDSGVAVVRVDGSRRLYRTDPAVLGVVAAWLDAVTPSFEPALDALATEVARGRRERRRSPRRSGAAEAGDGSRTA